MKPIIPFALLGAFFAVGAAKAASTNPVGYVTSIIEPNVSGASEGSATFISASLVRPAVFTGVASSSPSGGVTITFAGGVPASLDSTFLLEINNGAQEGWWSQVVSSTATSVTVVDAFPASLAADVSVTVRPLTTIQDVFGENSPGLAVFSNSGPYDEIQVLDPVTQSATPIIRVGDDWVDAVTEGIADTLPIYPGNAVKVIHRANTTLSVVVAGEVKTSDTQVDVYPGDNWLGQERPIGGTFADMFFGTQVSGSDFINLIRSDAGIGQPTDSFVAVGGSVYNAVTEELSDSESVSEGSGFLITSSSPSGYVLTIPSVPVAP